MVNNAGETMEDFLNSEWTIDIFGGIASTVSGGLTADYLKKPTKRIKISHNIKIYD